MKKHLSQAGQSTIEFIFCFIFAVSIILLVFNASLNYAAGYVVHYATFMASRVFLTQGSSSATWGSAGLSQAASKAESAFAAYRLDVFGIKNDAFKVNTGQAEVSADEYLMIGGYTMFTRKMDLVGQITGQQKLELVSESFLGREPTQGVCASRVCKAITGQDTCTSAGMDITLFDDGC
jgi:hypothetical protein